ncbi:hypothetical protein HGA15_34005, partial [Nocardia flavorosea]|nr:hypothetical protein [Nocardia flavorosea]
MNRGWTDIESMLTRFPATFEVLDNQLFPMVAAPPCGALTLSRGGLLAGSAVAALAAVAVVLGILLFGARGEPARERADAADRNRAEQIARDYSVGAATVDFQNLDAWLGKLKTGTVPDLSAKFDST